MSYSMVRMSHPRKGGLQSIMHRMVIVHLFDNTSIAGILHQTDEELFCDISELHYKPQHYCLTHFVSGEHATVIFRCSHIKYLQVFDFDNSIMPNAMMELSSRYYPQTYKEYT